MRTTCVLMNGKQVRRALSVRVLLIVACLTCMASVLYVARYLPVSISLNIKAHVQGRGVSWNVALHNVWTNGSHAAFCDVTSMTHAAHLRCTEFLHLPPAVSGRGSAAVHAEPTTSMAWMEALSGSASPTSSYEIATQNSAAIRQVLTGHYVQTLPHGCDPVARTAVLLPAHELRVPVDAARVLPTWRVSVADNLFFRIIYSLAPAAGSNEPDVQLIVTGDAAGDVVCQAAAPGTSERSTMHSLLAALQPTAWPHAGASHTDRAHGMCLHRVVVNAVEFDSTIPTATMLPPDVCVNPTELQVVGKDAARLATRSQTRTTAVALLSHTITFLEHNQRNVAASERDDEAGAACCIPGDGGVRDAKHAPGPSPTNWRVLLSDVCSRASPVVALVSGGAQAARARSVAAELQSLTGAAMIVADSTSNEWQWTPRTRTAAVHTPCAVLLADAQPSAALYTTLQIWPLALMRMQYTAFMTPAGGNLSCQATPGTKPPLLWSAASDARACGYCMEIPRSHASSNKAAAANRLFASSPIIDLSAGCQETGTVAVADGAVNGSHALAHNVACLLGMPFYSTPGTRMCSHNLEVGTSNADARLMADEIAQLLLQTIPASVNALDVDVCM